MNKQGFTLIELLVVVLIIGILTAVALPKYEQAVMRSRYNTLKANVRALYEAEQMYYTANGEYTADIEALSVGLSNCTAQSKYKSICTYPWGRCIIDTINERVSCENTQTLKNGYAIYLLGTSTTNPTFGVSCWAFTKDAHDKYSQLCEKEGGKWVMTASCTNPLGVGCRIYKISDSF